MRSHLRETKVWVFGCLSFYFQGVSGDKWLYLHGQDVTILT